MEKPNILVVEDDNTVREMLATALEMHGYGYYLAETGKKAIIEAISQIPDIVLLDLVLPDIDGIAVITKIREWSNMPILVISAKTDDQDKICALDAGADDYLTKPFSVDELLARLRSTVRRLQYIKMQGEDSSRTFQNGDLFIDYEAGSVFLEGKELHLTPIEYKLLKLLSKNVGRVLSYTSITREIWGTAWDNDVASLRVFMATLRKKIEADTAKPRYIQTHVGIGYRMLRIE